MPTQLCGPVTYDGGFPGLKPTMDPKEHFYRHFESQATGISRPHTSPFSHTMLTIFAALQDDIANLGNISVTGGERKDATDHVLSGISRLTNEVSDASEFAPPRDQMIYNEVCACIASPTPMLPAKISKGPQSPP